MSGFSKVRSLHSKKSNRLKSFFRRFGNPKAYWIGNFMSGRPICALTDPSWNCTMEWMIDCGCTTGTICSGFTLKSHFASMTSNPLFIMEAESIVILAPMLQFGCFRASLAVTVSRNFLSLPLNGPPEAVSMMRSIGLFSPTKHWKMAECSESTGRIGHLFLMARSHTSSPATTMVSLFAKAMAFPALRAAMVGCSPE